MLTEWDGLKVCPPCLDPRPPQMKPPNIYPEGIPFPDARPPQDNPDRLSDDTYLFMAGTSPGFLTQGFNPTDGVYPTAQSGANPTSPAIYTKWPSGQLAPIGAYSPQAITVSSIPPASPSASQLADDVTLKTGVIFAPSVPPPPPSPGTVPGGPLDPPKPPFYTP
jgi:hypothetical protein